MGWWDRFLGRAGAPAASTAPPAAAGPIPVPYLDGRTIIGLSAVWRCVTLIADLASDMPWTEWRDQELLAPSRLIRRPMATMTRREWTWRVVATEALFNACHLLHVGGTDSEGTPFSLLPIPPAIIAPAQQDPYGLLPPRAYSIAGHVYDAQFVTVIRRAPWPGIPDDVSGIIDIARRQFTAYLAADVHMARYWTNGGPTVTQIKTDQAINDDEAGEIAQRWVNRRAMGADYPAVLGSGAEAKPWGADPTTESAVQARLELNAEVGRYFGMPTRILNAPAGDSETYANVAQDRLDLYGYTLRGYIGPVEDAISELLPGDYLAGRRMELDPTRFLQGDLASRAEAWTKLVGAGVAIATVDEARDKGFGLPALPRASTSSTSVAITALPGTAATAAVTT